jgi:hypothetical protein
MTFLSDALELILTGALLVPASATATPTRTPDSLAPVTATKIALALTAT